MARRSGQVGYEEVNGGWYHVRFRIDVSGQEKRAYLGKPICPVSGPGALTKLERLRKRREIITASGADSQEHFEQLEAFNHGKTFPVSTVNNLAVRGLVTKMADAGMSPKMVNNVVQVVKMVVASAVNENGERVHPRTWNHEFIDLPEVRNQRQPTFTHFGCNWVQLRVCRLEPQSRFPLAPRPSSDFA